MENNQNNIKNILILLAIFAAICIIFITSLIIWRKWTISQSVECTIKITDLDNYYDSDEISKHIIYGEIVSEQYKGEKVRFQTSFENNYQIGDLVDGYVRHRGSYYYFIPKK